MLSLFLLFTAAATAALVLCSTTKPVLALAAAPLPPLASTTVSVADAAPLARRAIGYLDASTDPFWAVNSSAAILQAAGFVGLDAAEPFATQLLPGGKYYYTKNKSTLVAFCIGRKYRPGTAATFTIIGGHTDSPNLRVKPRSARTSAVPSCRLIGVETYGGGLWHTWFDRDLGLSGRVWVRNNGPDDDKIESKLIQLRKPLLRISNLAIHLQTAKEREAFAVNKEDHLSPILATQSQQALSAPTAVKKADNTTETDPAIKNGWHEHQEPALLQLLASELNCQVDDLVDFELSLFDVQGAATGGALDEFLYSARLDNLASCFLAVQALCEYASATTSCTTIANTTDTSTTSVEEEQEETDADAADEGDGQASGEQDDGETAEADEATKAAEEHVQDDADSQSTTPPSLLLDESSAISMICLYDHEEVGSSSAVGAASPILSEAVPRILAALNRGVPVTPDVVASTLAQSLVLSSDQAHAVHPNYASKHEKSHQPLMNAGGMVIKRNTNQRYATTPWTGVVLREIARRAHLPPLQEFVVRQDCGCGSTIGPIISSHTGIPAIDMGCPQLSMHSIREIMGVADLVNGLRLFTAFLELYPTVRRQVEN